MRLFEILKTVPLFADYYLKAVDEHSLQAPFVFDFYTHLKKASQYHGVWKDLETARHELLNDHSKLTVNDVGAGSRVNTAEKTVSRIAKYEISSPKKCALLSGLIGCGEYRTCVELGTSLGITTGYLAKTVKKGVVYTFEADPVLCQKAQNLLRQTGCENVKIIHGNIDESLPSFLGKMPSVDFALIDANHTGIALKRYFNMLKPVMAENGMIVVDDIRWSVDMFKAWKEIALHSGGLLSMEFKEIGVLLFKKNHPKQQYILENPA